VVSSSVNDNKETVLSSIPAAAKWNDVHG
jgi:hypothetical protein